ncbi:hypothetical protein CHS0354_008986 [Potamilus streckersoni]|uniref:EF-hand domain-containing protein n=1 Tax=Potamilus streckersoni TaxID=2493646 RepID=A0AAE0THK7_9BIVA|nr:hypothetical protein CHS0354_008986 [Potamilus streckersoni]
MASEQKDVNIAPRERETREYLEKHRILELFNNVTAKLIYHRPEDPKLYMIDMLEKLEKSRQNKQEHPCLFDDSNIEAVFGMLDPTHTGMITLKQYTEALITLGVTDFDQNPEGFETDSINFGTFLAEARDGLARASATFG